MAVSEAIYGITTSYVSSSAYYGFIPQNNQRNQPGENCNNNSNSSSGSGCWDVNASVNVNVNNMKEGCNWNGNIHQQQQPDDHAGAMETDDENHDVNDIVNNHCVIPDHLRRVINPTVYNFNYLDGYNDNNHLPGFVGSLNRQPTARQDAGAGRPGMINRKRNNDGELMPVQPDQLKRFRKEVVVTAALTCMVEDSQKMVDWPRCVISRHDCM